MTAQSKENATMTAAEGHVHAYLPGESFVGLVRRVAVEDGVDLYWAGMARLDRIVNTSAVTIGHAASEEERWTRYAAYVCQHLASLPRAELGGSVPEPAGDVDRAAEAERLLGTVHEAARIASAIAGRGHCGDDDAHALEGLLSEVRDAVPVLVAERDAAVARADTLAAQVAQLRGRFRLCDGCDATWERCDAIDAPAIKCCPDCRHAFPEAGGTP